MKHPSSLIVFGGLPGTGKTTIARELTARLAATYLRIDAIEQPLRDAGFHRRRSRLCRCQHARRRKPQARAHRHRGLRQSRAGKPRRMAADCLANRRRHRRD
ncbi:AAA family ATPase [Bradyrhizobium sp. NBAIM08]|uniref:AAA family ATPase n=1 Tax=Bradyrhizobium sp. NBAIM08 TaxID=2793815 RepID=UPI001CD7A7B4